MLDEGYNRWIYWIEWRCWVKGKYWSYWVGEDVRWVEMLDEVEVMSDWGSMAGR